MITAAELTAIPLFADLTDDQLAFVARSVEDIRLLPGEFAAREGDERALFLVVEGVMELTKDINGVERRVGKRRPGEMYGEVPMMLSTNLPASYGAIDASRVLKLDFGSFFMLAAMAPQVATTVGASAQGRIESLKELAAETATPDMVVIGPSIDPRVHEVRTFLNRNRISYDTIDMSDPQQAEQAAGHSSFPVVVLADGTRLVQPTVREIALAGRLPVAPEHDRYDVIIIGGGPTGLTAAVNGAAEGLRTLVVERFAPGGQAGTSTRIENYTGFPFGVSGDELAAKAMRQARRLGAEIIVTRAIEHIDPDAHTVTLDGGTVLHTRVVILTSGVEWRHVAIPDIERFIGNGVYYGAARSDSGIAHGKDIFIIGAGNSAGQAAIFFSRRSKSVTLIVRGESLGASMSQYLIEQLGSNPNVTIQTRSEVVALHGTEKLESIDVIDKRTQTVTNRAAEVLFVMIGADAETSWLPDEVARDGNGYVLTGPHAGTGGEWTLERDPFALETTAPGIFAAGDVRSGSVKRVAAGVGEGGMAIAFVHQYLALAPAEPVA
ncbi:thioredoxin reductase (NADPH) [Microbacterium sp. cf046]|uniref:FAD-dependent oxidoreductase n=1 Tax=Microbacterium sp. cf046 TaxID=1761803 RepID=UPI0008E94E3A|nr:FAD-dependent oxidoreductase [Microbacterium sp. cf046]SFR87241.1 thioredoxin reductase (NADPH) [Microbacterium sp. cf046]